MKEVAQLRRLVVNQQPEPEKPPARPRLSAKQREESQVKAVLSSLGDRISNPFIFTGTLPGVRGGTGWAGR